MVDTFTISGRGVGSGCPCFLIAEAGVNHNGCPDMALELVDVAAECGADAIKFQTFRAERLVTASARMARYQQANTGNDESQFEMLKRLELSREGHFALLERCRERGIIFMSTPFEEESADFLHELGVPVFKIPSGEMTNLPFLAHVAALGRPMIVSTGMCRLAEVEDAVRTIEAGGNRELVLLHCVSNSPADPANLCAMQTMQRAFQVPVGYSDHTEGTTVAVAAVTLGACVVEKHFTLDRSLPGPDHRASLEPDELRQLVGQIRVTESAMGSGRKERCDSESDTAAVARKSLVAASDIPAGSEITGEMIATLRPGTGLPPTMRPHFLDRLACQDIPAGTLLSLEMVQ